MILKAVLPKIKRTKEKYMNVDSSSRKYSMNEHCIPWTQWRKDSEKFLNSNDKSKTSFDELLYTQIRRLVKENSTLRYFDFQLFSSFVGDSVDTSECNNHEVWSQSTVMLFNTERIRAAQAHSGCFVILTSRVTRV